MLPSHLAPVRPYATVSQRARLCLAAAVLLAGCCAGCATRQEYGKFAEAGTAYTAALDHLLVVAGNVSLDATSERLLQDSAVSPQDLKSYQKLSSVDEERLAILGRLRLHARLLAGYFGALHDLAGSNAPERAGKAAGGIARDLTALGAQLRQAKLVPDPQVFQPATQLIVGAVVGGRLRQEIEKRKETIETELRTQEVLLKALGDAVKYDVALTKSAREQRLVIEPFLKQKALNKADGWIADRRAVMLSGAKIAELDAASGAAAALRNSFEDLVGGRLTLDRANALLTTVGALLQIAEVLDKP